MLSETEWLNEILQPHAIAVVTTDRNLETDRYIWGGKAFSPEGEHIEFDDATLVRKLLQKGETTGPTPEWRSFVGTQVTVEGKQYLAVGIEKGHPDRRHSYVSARYYLYPWDKLESAFVNIENLINHLESTAAAEGVVSVNGHSTRTIMRTESENIQEHQPIEATILRSALSAYSEGMPLTFRTALLSENQFQTLNVPYLAATVPAIEQTFNNQVQSQIAKFSQNQNESSCRQIATNSVFFSLAALTLLSITLSALSLIGYSRKKRQNNEISLKDISTDKGQSL